MVNAGAVKQLTAIHRKIVHHIRLSTLAAPTRFTIDADTAQ